MEKQTEIEILESVMKELQLIADIHLTNNQTLNENLISEYDLSLMAVGRCQGSIQALINKLKE
jgi:hypothetical protein